VLIPDGSDLGLSALFLSIALTVKNFFYDQNLTNLLKPYFTYFNVSIYEKKSIF